MNLFKTLKPEKRIYSKMKNVPNEKDWMLTLKGASGQPPTEHLLKVEGSSLRLTDAFIRPTGFGRHPTILDSTGKTPVFQKRTLWFTNVIHF